MCISITPIGLCPCSASRVFAKCARTVRRYRPGRCPYIRNYLMGFTVMCVSSSLSIILSVTIRVESKYYCRLVTHRKGVVVVMICVKVITTTEVVVMICVKVITTTESIIVPVATNTMID